MFFLVCKAYLKLIQFDFYVSRGNFQTLYEEVNSYPVKAKTSLEPVERVCAAFDMACIWYWKRVPCLQRSAATTCLLREHGVPAQMILGAQQMPFKAHAWVEVMGRVVNDKPYMRGIYAVLENADLQPASKEQEHECLLRQM